MSEQRLPEDEPVLGNDDDGETPGGAEDGLSPLDDESYSADPEGPSQVAGD
jgi:hypothetical protein